MGGEASKFYSVAELDEFYDVVKIGDVLEFSRGVYSHFGVYIGFHTGIAHCVVHFTIPDDNESEEIVKYFRNQLCSSNSSSSSQSIDHAVLRTNQHFNKMVGKNIGEICLQSVKTVMGPFGSVKITNRYDDSSSVEEPRAIRDRALRAYKDQEPKENQRSYNVLSNNCEHFANDLRYGSRRSNQVEQTINGLMGGAIAIGVIAGAIGAIATAVDTESKKKEDKPMRNAYY